MLGIVGEALVCCCKGGQSLHVGRGAASSRLVTTGLAVLGRLVVARAGMGRRGVAGREPQLSKFLLKGEDQLSWFLNLGSHVGEAGGGFPQYAQLALGWQEGGRCWLSIV